MKILKNVYFRASLAIIFYILTMEVFGPYLVVPLFSKIFNLDFYDNVLTLINPQFSFFIKGAKELYGALNVMLQAGIYILAIFFLIICLYPEIKNDYNLYHSNEAKILNTIGIGILLYFGLTIASNILSQALGRINGSIPESQNQNAIVELFNGNWLLKITMLITTVIVGPLVEELVFRKSIFKLIPNGIVSIIVSSILFGLLHTISFNYSFMELIIVTIPYIGAGISFGWVYYKTNNIYASYMLHAGLNLLSVLMILFM